jgi:hypothetical protein
MSMSGGLDDRVDALYRVDPDEFVAARNGLARELRQEGHRESSATVRRLPKPSLVAWALNQVAVGNPDDIADAVRLTDDVRMAQQAAGKGDAEGLRSAANGRRAIVRRVVDDAVKVLASRNGSAAETHREELRATVEAATLDPDVAALLVAGRLERELPLPADLGFGLPDDPAPDAPGTDNPEERHREARRVLAEAEDAAELAAEARERAREAATAAQEARKLIENLQSAMEDARIEATRAVEAARLESLRAAEMEQRAAHARELAQRLDP